MVPIRMRTCQPPVSIRAPRPALATCRRLLRTSTLPLSRWVRGGSQGEMRDATTHAHVSHAFAHPRPSCDLQERSLTLLLSPDNAVQEAPFASLRTTLERGDLKNIDFVSSRPPPLTLLATEPGALRLCHRAPAAATGQAAEAAQRAQRHHRHRRRRRGAATLQHGVLAVAARRSRRQVHVALRLNDGGRRRPRRGAAATAAAGGAPERPRAVR